MKKILFMMLLSMLCGSMEAQTVGIIPEPQKVETSSGCLYLEDTLNFVSAISTDDILPAAWTDCPLPFVGSTAKAKSKKSTQTVIELKLNPSLKFPRNASQGYLLDIGKKSITIEAITIQGLYYGVLSLRQLVVKAMVEDAKRPHIDCMTVVDYPVLEYRGWMDDLSRGPIPTMDFLKKEIRTMAMYKMNFFNLYTEHVFRLKSYPDIAPNDGLTAEQIQELTDYARQYHIELFGNQQCFAHAEKMLRIPYYRNISDTRYNLNPGTDLTYTFLEDMFAEVASAYSSPFMNINCDETEGLGAGRAKDYVDSVGGADNAYCRHINRVYNILQRYNKTVMMWGDIIAKNPAMINHLPKDIQFIVWSYVDADSFNNHIDPIAQSGHPFWVASGMSMWSTVFPLVDVYIKNIANLIRDGYIAGAKGVMNTAWDDSGESLFNSAWHGMAWTAEMAWKPIYNTSVSLADSERRDREETFNKVFNIQYFRTKQSIVPLLYSIGNMSTHADIGSRVNTGTLNEPLLDFYPSKVGDEVIESSKKVMEITKRLSDKCKEIINDTTISNRDIFLNAKYAADRVGATAQKNMLRALLHRVYVSPTADNIAQAKQYTDSLLRTLQMLKYSYLNLWDYECRQYSRDIITDRYDHFANELLDLENHVFISTQLSTEGKPVVSLRTLYNDRPIYYTTDGGKPSKATKIYDQPFGISQSCIVKAVSYDAYGDSKATESYILYHKGMGHLKRINTAYSTYNATYSAGGDNALLDGVVGSDYSYADGHWQGYWGVDVDVEMDFGKVIDVNSVSMRFLQNTFDWILAPRMVEIYTSNDGENYKPVRQHALEPDFRLSGNRVNPVAVHDLNVNTRYLRVVAKNPGKLPDWHPAKGNDSYLFVDEIVVE